jgi:hypothetical protein
MAQNCSAPVRVRRQPETFCRILIIRISRSAALLSNGTRNDLGGGFAGPSDDGCLDEFRLLLPSCVSSSAILASACASRAGNSTTNAASSS